MRRYSASSVSSAITRAACAAISPTGSRNPSTPCVDQFRRRRRSACATGGNSARHRFQRGESEGFHFARHQQHVGLRDQALDVILLAQERRHDLPTPNSRASISAGPRSGPSPTITQMRGRRLAELPAECGCNPARVSPAGNSKDGSDAFPSRSALRIGLVQIAVDEVVDHADRVRDSENFHRLLLQIIADGGDAVGFFDGKFGDRKIRAVGADQRNVGAVQRRDERQPPRRWSSAGRAGRRSNAESRSGHAADRDRSTRRPPPSATPAPDSTADIETAGKWKLRLRDNGCAGVPGSRRIGFA